jgi:hypothetical protein
VGADTRYRRTGALAALACALLLAACGSAGKPSADAANDHEVGVRFASCMRQHGVPNYPDPTYKDGHEIPPFIADPAINPASPAFGAASKACQSP